MNKHTFSEKTLKPISGGVMLIISILGILACTALFVLGVLGLVDGSWATGGIMMAGGIVGWIVFPILLGGLKIVRPNEARVLLLFGNYYGTIKQSGFYYVNPFCSSFSPAYEDAMDKAKTEAQASQKEGKISFASVKTSKAISLKRQTLDNRKQKVNDVMGNPIVIGAAVVWRVVDPTRAVFSVENYHEFLNIQTDAIIRNTARLYPYDLFEDDSDIDDLSHEKTLRSSSMEIAESMRIELQAKVEEAGLIIEEIRITHLAYAEEIAAAMLQRQQAAAVIAARTKIVDGAVGMVKMAIERLNEDQVVLLDEERKAAMVSNLMVVLCGNKDAQPIVNSGSIY